jgi:hypothetical protein
MEKTNKTYNPKNISSVREHRPLRWIVRQWVTEEDGTRIQIETGYHSSLEKIPKMTPILAQALNNINRFGGELFADYGEGLGNEVLITNYK